MLAVRFPSPSLIPTTTLNTFPPCLVFRPPAPKLKLKLKKNIERESPCACFRARNNNNTSMTEDQTYDRLKEVKQFDDSKIGVKGLVDSGLTSIPRFFLHPPETLPTTRPASNPTDHTIPVVDLSADRSTVVDEIRRASSTLGFFQVINHKIPPEILHHTIDSIKAFNEQPTEIKARHYHREMGRGAAFSTNFDLFQSKAASWRDTLQIRLVGPGDDDYGHVPLVCRAEVVAWDREIQRLGDDLMGLLSEGLGTRRDRLKEMSCLDARVMVGHYYPYCPQPDLTVGITSHTDPGVLTVLIQNEIGGLQVKYGEDEWVDVEPLPGAIVINIGDMLQIMSNDIYKSVEHRVLANPFPEPRVSAAIFFNPGLRDNLFGPLSELISPNTPAVYRDFTFTDFMQRFFKKELDGKTLVGYYKL